MRIYDGFSVSDGIAYGKAVTLFYEKIFIQDKILDNEKEKELFVVKMKDNLPERGIAACYNDMGQIAEPVFQFLNLLKNE